MFLPLHLFSGKYNMVGVNKAKAYVVFEIVVTKNCGE
jgi:hypothetical protein